MFIHLGVVVAGAALYATTREDGVGTAARVTGNTAVSAYDRAAESAEKHHVGEKIAAVSKATYKKTIELDNQYHISENVKSAGAVAISEAQKLNEKYDITGKSSRAIASGARSVFKILEGSNGTATTSSTTT